VCRTRAKTSSIPHESAAELLSPTATHLSPRMVLQMESRRLLRTARVVARLRSRTDILHGADASPALKPDACLNTQWSPEPCLLPCACACVRLLVPPTPLVLWPPLNRSRCTTWPQCLLQLHLCHSSAEPPLRVTVKCCSSPPQSSKVVYRQQRRTATLATLPDTYEHLQCSCHMPGCIEAVARFSSAHVH
jgi:hypothetical protein